MIMDGGSVLWIQAAESYNQIFQCPLHANSCRFVAICKSGIRHAGAGWGA
jgi:hypothetical protein